MKKKKTGPGKRWKPGQSGNPKGRPAGRPELSQLLFEIGQEISGKGMSNLEGLIRVLYLKALEGNLKAVDIVLERLLGKIPTPVEGTPNGEPVKIVLLHSTVGVGPNGETVYLDPEGKIIGPVL